MVNAPEQPTPKALKVVDAPGVIPCHKIDASGRLPALLRIIPPPPDAPIHPSVTPVPLVAPRTILKSSTVKVLI